MTAGIKQLGYVNSVDIFLTGNPVFTFFKAVYRRYTAFSLETKEFSTPLRFGGKTECVINTDGDLIHSMTLQVRLPEVRMKAVDYEKEKWDYLDQSRHQPMIQRGARQDDENNDVITSGLDAYYRRLIVKRLRNSIKGSITTEACKVIEEVAFQQEPITAPLIRSFITTGFVSTEQVDPKGLAELTAFLILLVIFRIWSCARCLRSILSSTTLSNFVDGSVHEQWGTALSFFPFYSQNMNAKWIDIVDSFVQQKTSDVSTTMNDAVKSLGKRDGVSIVDLLNSSLASKVRTELPSQLPSDDQTRAGTAAVSEDYNAKGIKQTVDDIVRIYTSYLDEGIVASATQDIIATDTQHGLIEQAFVAQYQQVYLTGFLAIYDSVMPELGLDVSTDDLRNQPSRLLPTVGSSLDEFMENIETLWDKVVVEVFNCYSWCRVASYILDVPIGARDPERFGQELIDKVSMYEEDNKAYQTVTDLMKETGIGTVSILPSPTLMDIGLEDIVHENIRFDFIDVVLRELLTEADMVPSGHGVLEHIKAYYRTGRQSHVAAIESMLGITSALSTLDRFPYYRRKMYLFDTLLDGVLLILPPLDTSDESYVSQCLQDFVLSASLEHLQLLVQRFNVPLDAIRTVIASSAVIPREDKMSYVSKHAMMSESFMEAAYLEYINKEVRRVLPDYESWSATLATLVEDPSMYELQILRSFTFFNLAEIVRKVPRSRDALMTLYRSTPWKTKIRFISIMDQEAFIEYVRTNTKACDALYNLALKEVAGEQAWSSIMYTHAFGVRMTCIDEWHLRQKIETVPGDLYDAYVASLQGQATSVLADIQSGRDRSAVCDILDSERLRNMSFGRYYTGIRPLQIVLHPNTRIRLYGKDLFRDLLAEYMNDTDTSKAFSPGKGIRDCVACFIIDAANLQNGTYKGLRGIPMDLKHWLGIEWEIADWPLRLLRRRTPTDMERVTVITEALEQYRWFIYNDYTTLCDWIGNKKGQPTKDPSLLPSDTLLAWRDRVGEHLLKTVEFYIGDQRVDMFDDEWLEIYHSYFRNRSHDRGYNIMTGNVDRLCGKKRQGFDRYLLHIPLPFWFNQSNTQALPIVALTNHRVMVRVSLRKLNEVLLGYGSQTYCDVGDIQAKLLIDYVYLDMQERRAFIQKRHQYLMRSLSICEVSSLLSPRLRFSFNLPVSDLFIVLRDKRTGEICQTVRTVDIVINGESMTPVKNVELYTQLIPWEKYYTPIPGIMTMSFALEPTSLQPSGSMNFYYVVDSFVDFTFKDGMLPSNLSAKVYARQYNVLQIMSGQAGLLYS